MTTRINLPDGSVVNVPEGVSLEQAQAEIERFLSARQGQSPAAPERRVMTPGQEIARDIGRFRDTVGRGNQEFQENFDWQGQPETPEPRQIPMKAMEESYQREAQRRGPPRRNAEISIREAIAQERQPYQQPRPQRKSRTPEVNTDQGPPRRRAEVSIREASDNFEENFEWSGGPSGTPPEPSPEKDPSEMTNAELRAAEIAARSPMRELATDAAEAFTGGVRWAGEALQERAGRAAAGLGMTNVGARLLQGAEDTAALSERRRQEEAQREAAAASDAQRYAEELARRAGAAQPAPGEGQPNLGVARPATQADQAARTQTPQMPRAMSVQGAREQQLGAASQAPLSTGQTIASKPGKAPPEALRNGTKTGMDYILEQGEQYVLQRLKRGDIAGAMEFRNFMRNEQNIRGLENFNRAVVATTLRDTETFAKSTADMVRYLDPDGEWEVDTKGTQLLFSDDGQVTGAEVALKNKRTGETLVNEYQGMKAVLDGLGDFASPTAGIERQRQRVEQAQAQKIENAKNFTSAYDAAAELLFPDGFKDGTTGKAFTPEERQQADTAIREYIASSRPDLPQPSPRSAPAGQPPQSASGVGSSIRSFFGGSTGDQPVPTWGG